MVNRASRHCTNCGRIQHVNHRTEVASSRTLPCRALPSAASLELLFVSQDPHQRIRNSEPSISSEPPWSSNGTAAAYKNGGIQQPVVDNQPSTSGSAIGVNGHSSTSARAINQRIAGAQHWSQIADLVQQKGNSLTSVHVATAFCRLVHLAAGARANKSDKAAVDKLINRLMHLAAQTFSSAEPQAFSNTVWAVAKLDIVPTKPWLSTFLQASRGQLHLFKPQHLSMTIWALSSLSHAPFKPWLEDFYTSCSSQLPRFTTQGLAITLWALANLSTATSTKHTHTAHIPAVSSELTHLDISHSPLHHETLTNHVNALHAHTISASGGVPAPPVHWIDSMLTALHSRLEYCTPQNLSNTLWALAVWQHQPPASWLEPVLAQCHTLMLSHQPQGYSNIMWALAKLEVRPSEEWLQAFWTATGPQLDRFQPQHLSSTLWGLATLQIQPPDEWRQQVLQVVYDKFGNLGMEFEGQALSNTIWAVSQLNWTPEQQWLDVFAARAKEGLVGLGPQSLANLIVALARLQYRPRTRWRKAFAARTLQLLPRFTPQGLVSVLWAVSRLGIRMPQEWLRACTNAAVPLMPSMGDRDHSLLIWALAKKRFVPEPEWLQAFESSSLSQLQSSSHQHLCNIMWSFARLRHRPADGWLTECMTRVEVLLPTFRCQDCSNLLWSLAVMQHRPALLPKLLDQFVMVLKDGCSNEELAQMAWAVEALKLQPSQQWLAAVVTYSGSRISALNLLAARSLLCMLVSCKCDPGPEYLAEMTQAARNLLLNSTVESPQQKERCSRDINFAVRKLQTVTMMVSSPMLHPLDRPSNLQFTPVTNSALPAASLTDAEVVLDVP